ncbi:type II toxin-antitoxin system RelE/ParE family toxin [Luteimonas marina]|uniref:Type II toxin-antitoxin system RelE/ParE family toxin n=1 Tax=Luteimonas marina TaxID=488485 RepID=A0A5C5UC93_9GAMM|nr:type II toxin-antitoxin system RelE/ParE family toxin [Luteimonas marina]TWT23528.1 type II toxin-antitoxin system RelE/ParE family toxin [Luteimonas marina]
MAIKSFRDKATAALFLGLPVKGLPVDLRKRARAKLAILNRAGALDDLRVPPGNRLEALKRDRAGQHSIRVNDQFRICFTWTGSDAENVEFVDYH